MSLEDEIGKLTIRDKVSYIKRLEIRDTMTLFANEHHRNTSGNPMRFDTFQHMIELYEEGALHKDIVIMAGTQIGKTDWLIIYVLAAAYCGLNVFYILPKDDMRDTYVSEKVLRPIKLSPFYQEILKDATSKSRDLINFGAGTIKFVGGKSEANFTSYSADIIIVDETDQMSVPGNIDIGMGRLNQSIHKYSRFVSNPSTTKGFINQRYELSDKRVRKYPCTKCGKQQELDFFECVVEVKYDEDNNPINHVLRDKDWISGDSNDIKAMCTYEGCTGHLDRESTDAIWEATTVSKRGIVGYLMPSFCSINVELRDVYKSYLDGLESISKMQAFHIKHVATPYTSAGNKVSEDILDRCVEEGYNFHIKEDQAYAHERVKTPCIMGIDVASDHWDISISHQERPRDPETHRLVFLGKMSPKDGLFFLHDLVDRYNVICAVIDMVPETLQAMQFQDEAECIVWRANFWNTAGRETQFKDDLGQVNVNHTEMLDKAYSIIRNGKLIVPENYNDIFEGVFVKEMTALTRVTEQNTKGVFINKWEGSSNNHHRFADGFRNLAREIMSQDILRGEDVIYVG